MARTSDRLKTECCAVLCSTWMELLLTVTRLTGGRGKSFWAQ